jgi:hypothetical protein
MGVILRSKATKNLIVTGSAEILRGACPACPERSLGEPACPELVEWVEGLRMTWSSFGMETCQSNTYNCNSIFKKIKKKPSNRVGYFSLGQTPSARVEGSEPALLTTSGYVVNNKDKKGRRVYIITLKVKFCGAVHRARYNHLLASNPHLRSEFAGRRRNRIRSAIDRRGRSTCEPCRKDPRSLPTYRGYRIQLRPTVRDAVSIQKIFPS